MKKFAIVVAILVTLASPVASNASCWECIGDYCHELGFWMSGNYHFGRSNCTQRPRCFPQGECVTDCWTFGTACTYWDVWF